MSQAQLTGMAGVYFVAAELSLRDLIVSPTSRGANAADLLVTDEKCQRTYSIQVKTNRSTFAFWLMSEKCKQLVSDSLIYVLVNILSQEKREYFVVPSIVVADKIIVSPKSDTRKQTAYSLRKKDILAFQDRWDLITEKTEANQALEHNDPSRHASCCAPVAPTGIVAHL